MITTTDKSVLKTKMLEACIRKQGDLIDDLKTRIKELLETGPLGNEEEYDNTVLAQNAQNADEINSVNAALKFASDEMDVLNHLRSTLDRSCTKASPVAVVVTNQSVFFVSVSIEQFEVDGETFVGLSDKSPLFQAMKGKKKGQKFSYKGITYKITDIF